MPELHLIKGKEYKVQDKDTLDSIAKANSLTWQQLAKFNWGTEDEAEVNLKLRDKVGSRKKSEDGTKFILTKDDDPGIIYIPITPSAPQKYASKTSTSLTVKVPQKKTYKSSDVTVRFRPKEGWKGESYGFDWFRAADYKLNNLFGALDFNKDIFGKLYIPKGAAANTQTLQTDGNSYTGDFRADPTMLTNAKTNEYLLQKVKDTANKDMEVFGSHINIYINDKDLKPPQTVDIQAIVNVGNEVLDELQFVFKTPGDKDFLTITPTGTLTKMAVAKDKKIPISLKVLKEITAKIEIQAKAITRTTDGSYLEKVVGTLIVHPNAAANRKHIKILLIEVKTPALATGGTAASPDMTNQEAMFTKLLRQAMVNPIIKKPNIVLDLTAEADFKTNFVTVQDSKSKIMAYKWSGTGYVKIDGKYNNIQSYLDVKLKAQLVKANSPIANKLDEYIKAYYFGEDGCSDVNASISNLNGYSTGKYVVMFKSRNEGTSPHEFLHSLGLPHTFDTGATATDDVSKNAQYSYKYATTDNIMDYTHHLGGAYENGRLCTFQWQWGVVFAHPYSLDHDE